MDQSASVAKARQFADTAYGVEVARISRESQEKLRQVQAQLAARGLARSGAMTSETARIHAERITTLLQARLDSLLEGYELHGVQLDDQLTSDTITELTQHRATMISQAVNSVVIGGVDVGAGASFYAQTLEQQVGMYQNEIKVQIDRKRLQPRKPDPSPSITVYHVEGDNSRVNVNSNDTSVNVVIKPSKEIFANLRQEIESKVAAGDDQRLVLEKLAVLEEAQGSKSFAQRYTEFIAVAANHMELLAPFIPALTELLRQALK